MQNGVLFCETGNANSLKSWLEGQHEMHCIITMEIIRFHLFIGIFKKIIYLNGIFQFKIYSNIREEFSKFFLWCNVAQLDAINLHLIILSFFTVLI